MMYRDRIRCATDETLRGLVAFFDAPELRRYYAGLLEDARCELQLRAAGKAESEPKPRKQKGAPPCDEGDDSDE